MKRLLACLALCASLYASAQDDNCTVLGVQELTVLLHEIQSELDSIQNGNPSQEINFSSWTFTCSNWGTGSNCNTDNLDGDSSDGYSFPLSYNGIMWREFSISGEGVENVDSIGLRYWSRSLIKGCNDGYRYNPAFWISGELGETQGAIKWNHTRTSNFNSLSTGLYTVGGCGSLPSLEGGVLNTNNNPYGCHEARKRQFEVLVKIDGVWRDAGFAFDTPMN